MGLIKHRPTIRLFAPAQAQIGHRFGVRPVIDCATELEVNAINVELVGLQIYYTQSQYGQHKHAEEFCRATHNSRGEGLLSAGAHEFEASFEIPPDYAATYFGKKVRIEWEIRVHVDIPWWPDAKAAFNLTVLAAPCAVEPTLGKVWSSRPEGAPPKKPYLELSVGDLQVEPGGTVDGAVALGNVEFNEYRALDVALVAVERIDAGLLTSHLHSEVARWRLELDQPGEHEPVRFTLRLPSDLVPAFEMRRVGLAWFLRVDVDVAWSLDPRVWVPLQVRPRLPGQLALAPAPLAVGAERIELVWRQVAEQTGFNYVNHVLRRAHGHTEVEVRREHRGKRGAHVVADIQIPDLGVDLGWHARAGLTARDDSQVLALREHLGPRLADLGPAFVDDRLIRFELEDAGQRVEPLVPFVGQVFELAAELDQLREEIPPPAAVADQLPGWQRAAAGVGGRLLPSAMRITGSRGEMPFSLGLSFKSSGPADRFVLTVRPSVRLAARHHRSWAAATAVGEGARRQEEDQDIAELTRHCTRLEIDDSRIEVELDAGAAGVEDAVSVLERMLALGRRLSGKIGPYR